MRRPIPGVLTIEYRKGSQRFHRCSRCHGEHPQSSLVLDTVRANANALLPVMVGQDLLGMVCSECAPALLVHIQQVFPDRHAWPFVDSAGQLLPNPRCELGHVLVYTPDGTGMACPTCDVVAAVD